MKTAEPNKLYRKSGVWGTRLRGGSGLDALYIVYGTLKPFFFANERKSPHTAVFFPFEDAAPP